MMSFKLHLTNLCKTVNAALDAVQILPVPFHQLPIYVKKLVTSPGTFI